MLYVYLLIWNPMLPERFDRQTVINFLDMLPEVVNWRASTGGILIVSRHDVNVLTAKLHEKLLKMNFILARIPGLTSQGWTDADTWKFINNPTPIRGSM